MGRRLREILFRGKHKATGKWCEGNLHIDKQGVAIITPDDTPLGVYGQVDPDTVGQYTGLVDKNGTKIFEGDVVRAVLKASKSSLPFEWPAAPVVYKGSSFGLAYKRNFGFVRLDGFAPMVTFEVIGNVHDNPELMR